MTKHKSTTTEKSTSSESDPKTDTKTDLKTDLKTDPGSTRVRMHRRSAELRGEESRDLDPDFDRAREQDPGQDQSQDFQRQLRERIRGPEVHRRGLSESVLFQDKAPDLNSEEYVEALKKYLQPRADSRIELWFFAAFALSFFTIPLLSILPSIDYDLSRLNSVHLYFLLGVLVILGLILGALVFNRRRQSSDLRPYQREASEFARFNVQTARVVRSSLRIGAGGFGSKSRLVWQRQDSAETGVSPRLPSHVVWCATPGELVYIAVDSRGLEKSFFLAIQSNDRSRSLVLKLEEAVRRLGP